MGSMPPTGRSSRRETLRKWVAAPGWDASRAFLQYPQNS